MITRTFGSFAFDEVEDLFNIQQVDALPILNEWLAPLLKTNEHEDYFLHEAKNELKKFVLQWNEDELKMFFIGPIIKMAKLETEAFKPFTQRNLIATINTIEVSGRIDFMIAKGKRTAKPPYFCIHEYKQEIGSDGEPLGQLLIAMLAAQTLNENKFPILGAYIVGRNWFFVVLEDSQYAVSPSYDAASDDIFQIFAILQKSKEIIQRFI